MRETYEDGILAINKLRTVLPVTDLDALVVGSGAVSGGQEILDGGLEYLFRFYSVLAHIF